MLHAIATTSLVLWTLLSPPASGDPSKTSDKFPVPSTNSTDHPNAITLSPIAIQGEDQVIECKFELPPIACGAKQNITVTLQNQLGFDFQAQQISTSCGCITRLPGELELKKGSEAILEFEITMPRSPEAFSRYITLSDQVQGRSIRLAFSATAQSRIVIKNEVVRLSNAKTSKHILKLESVFPDLDMRQVRARIEAPEIIKFDLNPVDDRMAELSLVIDPGKVPSEDFLSEVVVEFLVDKTLILSSKIRLENPFRTVVKPETMQFRLVNKELEATAMIYSVVLQQQLEKGQKLCAKLEDHPNVKPTVIIASSEKPSNPLAKISVSIPSQELSSLKKPSSSLTLYTENWSVRVPFTVHHE